MLKILHSNLDGSNITTTKIPKSKLVSTLAILDGNCQKIESVSTKTKIIIDKVN